MSELHRGQHPYAVSQFMTDNGPQTWSNKVEVDRARWEERYVGELADGGNPFAVVETKGGLDLATRAKLARHGKQLAENTAKWEKEHKGAKVAGNPWVDADGDGVGDAPGSPAAMGFSSKSPGSPQTVYFTRYGPKTEDQRQARVAELTKKLGVDKAQENLVTKSVIDTTAPAAGYGFTETSRSTARTTRRGGNWPVSADYINDK